MGCFTPWIFVDDAGNAWAVGVSTVGALTLANVLPVPPQAMRLVPLKDIVTGAVFGVKVIFIVAQQRPQIVSTGPLSIAAVGGFIPMTAPGGRPFWLQVASGQLIGTWQAAGGVTDPVVGELYNYDMVNPPKNPPNLANPGLNPHTPGGWLPSYTQPGGIGTQTFPQQAQGSESMITGVPFEVGMGMNTAGCGHWFNNYEQIQATVGCQPYSLVRCPLCGFIQEMFPLAVAYDQYHEHISS